MSRFSLLAMSLAGASVALVILVDLATGQGPPALNAFLGRAPQHVTLYRPLPPSPSMNYMPRRDHDSKKEDYKEEMGFKDSDKEKEKDDKSIHNPYPVKNYEKEHDKSTPAPGVLSSFSKSMTGAWNSLTSLGRSKRDAKSSPSPSTARSFDDDQRKSRPYSGNEKYIFFKVPRKLVCENY